MRKDECNQVIGLRQDDAFRWPCEKAKAREEIIQRMGEKREPDAFGFVQKKS